MKFKYTIMGIDCPNCAAKLAAIIGGKEGIDAAKINFLSERLTVESPLDEAEVYEIACKEAKKFSSDIVIER